MSEITREEREQWREETAYQGDGRSLFIRRLLDALESSEQLARSLNQAAAKQAAELQAKLEAAEARAETLNEIAERAEDVLSAIRAERDTLREALREAASALMWGQCKEDAAKARAALEASEKASAS